MIDFEKIAKYVVPPRIFDKPGIGNCASGIRYVRLD